MKMKAAVVTQNSDGNVEIVEREIRPLEHGEALVEVEYCGVCHTTCTLRQVITAKNRAVCWATKVSVW